MSHFSWVLFSAEPSAIVATWRKGGESSEKKKKEKKKEKKNTATAAWRTMLLCDNGARSWSRQLLAADRHVWRNKNFERGDGEQQEGEGETLDARPGGPPPSRFERENCSVGPISRG